MRDIQYAWRRLRRTPGFTVTAVLTLALGIAATTTAFAMVHAFKWTPPAYVRVADAYYLRQRLPASPTPRLIALADFRRIEAAFADGATIVAAYSYEPEVPVRVRGIAEVLRPEPVSGRFASLMGLRTQLGRWIEPSDDHSVGAARVAVISDRLFRGWFGGNAAIVGRSSLVIDRVDYQIVGVAPRDFYGVFGVFDARDVWIPLAQRPGHWAANRALFTLVRPPGPAEVRAVEAAATAVLSASSETSPPSTSAPLMRAVVSPVSGDLRLGPYWSVLVTTLGLAGLVLIAACANLANMIYARVAQRAGETAVRLSLGARRGQVIRPLLTEIGLIVMLAAGAAILICIASMQAFAAAFPLVQVKTTEQSFSANLDARVFLVAVASALVAAALVAAVTLLYAMRAAPLRGLGTSASGVVAPHTGARLRTTLVAIQVAAAVVLLIGSGLLVGGVLDLVNRSILFDTSPMATARLDLKSAGYGESRGRALFDRLLSTVGSQSGVERVALASTMPAAAGALAASGKVLLSVEPNPTRPGTPPRRVDATMVKASTGFLATVGVPILRGRDLAPQDREGGRLVAVISESAADALWPGEDALGMRFQVGALGRWMTVVGIAADPVRSSSDYSTYTQWANFAFLPLDQHYTDQLLVVVRSSSAEGQVAALRQAIAAVDDSLAVFDASTLDGALLARAGPMRLAATLMAAIGALAIVVALLGVYGVMAYFVSTRTREFGVRIALGATPARISRMVIDQGVHVVLVGLLPGVLIASLASNVVGLFSIGSPNAVATWFAVPLLLLVAGVAACYFPARRASRVDPNVALRNP